MRGIRRAGCAGTGPARRPGMAKWLGAALLAGAVFVVHRTRRARQIDGFHSRVVLITGGSRGLGLVLARTFGDEGAHVVICARDGAELERAHADLRRRGIAAEVVVCDVTDRAAITGAIERVIATHGRLDVLVNNAGVIDVGPLEELTREDYERAMQTHFWAPLYAVEAVLPAMRRRGFGRIVNIASIGGKISVPHLAAYSASKYALVGLSRALRSELAPHGIVVTTVCPGLMRTGGHRHAAFKGRHRAEHAWFSIADALPGLTMSAEQAAAEIVEACRRGDAEAVLSLPARVADTASALFPELTADVLTLAGRLLPAPGGIGTERRAGHESASRLSPSPLTALSDRAAQRNNEEPAPA